MEGDRQDKVSLNSLYDRLSESARELFARMSFFPGGLSRSFDDLLELLGDSWKDTAGEMVDHALVEYDRSTDRYTMTQAVMEHAREKLDEGEGDDFRQRATRFWAEFAQWYDLMLDVQPVEGVEIQIPELPDDSVRRQSTLEPMQSNSFAMMVAEEDNVVHAAEWALKAGNETGLGIMDSLEDYLELRKQWHTKERLYRLALSRRRQLAAAIPSEYMPDVASTLNNMGELLRKTEKFDKAKACFQEALRIYRDVSQSQPGVYTTDMAAALNNMAALHSQTGLPDEALVYYKESLSIYREFFQRYPSAYSEELLSTLKDATEVYQKLGLNKRVKECQDEIEQLLS